jgi:hypothetical protein
VTQVLAALQAIPSRITGASPVVTKIPADGGSIEAARLWAERWALPS